MVGLKPHEIYSLEMWEYNTCLQAYSEKQKADVYSSILTGYYTAYYMNIGKKAKTPYEIMQKTFEPKQSFEEGICQINKIKQLEEKGGE